MDLTSLHLEENCENLRWLRTYFLMFMFTSSHEKVRINSWRHVTSDLWPLMNFAPHAPAKSLPFTGFRVYVPREAVSKWINLGYFESMSLWLIYGVNFRSISGIKRQKMASPNSSELTPFEEFCGGSFWVSLCIHFSMFSSFNMVMCLVLNMSTLKIGFMYTIFAQSWFHISLCTL